MSKYGKFFSSLLVGILIIVGIFSSWSAYAAAPTFTAARTALNTIVLTFSEAVDASDTATAAWTVAGATVSAVTDPGLTTTLIITTTGLTSTSSTPLVTYVAASGTVVNGAVEEVADGTNASATDVVPPTFTAARTALNTIVLTFSENVTGTAIADSFTVVGASAVTNSAVTGGTSVTLTTTGLTSTSSTPAVGYVAATGNILDNSAATNEVANGGAISAADQVPPTFTANRTALNTIVLTFSENVTGTAIADSFTVVGASSVTNTAVTGGTAVTLTTVGLTSTSSTPAVGYVAATGNILDNSAATNEVANGGAISAADAVIPVFSSAVVNSSTLTMTYGEALNSSSAPAVGSFEVLLDGVARSVSVVTVTGSTVVLTLSSGSTAGQVVTVAYTTPGSDEIEDASAAGNDAASLTATAVTNNSSGGGGGGGGSSSSSSTTTTPTTTTTNSTTTDTTTTTTPTTTTTTTTTTDTTTTTTNTDTNNSETSETLITPLVGANTLAASGFIVDRSFDTETYRLDDNVLRQEAIGVVANVLGILIVPLDEYVCQNKFPDATASTGWVCRSAELAAAAGLTNPGNTLFRPKDTLTHFEGLVFALRASKLVPENADVDGNGIVDREDFILLGVNNSIILSANFHVNSVISRGEFFQYVVRALEVAKK